MKQYLTYSWNGTLEWIPLKNKTEKHIYRFSTSVRYELTFCMPRSVYGPKCCGRTTGMRVETLTTGSDSPHLPFAFKTDLYIVGTQFDSITRSTDLNGLSEMWERRAQTVVNKMKSETSGASRSSKSRAILYPYTCVIMLYMCIRVCVRVDVCVRVVIRVRWRRSNLLSVGSIQNNITNVSSYNGLG